MPNIFGASLITIRALQGDNPWDAHYSNEFGTGGDTGIVSGDNGENTDSSEIVLPPPD